MSRNKHKKPVTPEPEILTRRNFLKLGFAALNTIAAVELIGAGVIFLRSRSLEGEYGGVMKAGFVEDFLPGSVTEYTDGHFFLVRSQDGGFMALHQRCPHLGCTVDWTPEDERFYCPCHASSFDIYGNFNNKSVPRALDIFEVSFKDNEVMVDTTKPIQRESFDKSQLAYL